MNSVLCREHHDCFKSLILQLYKIAKYCSKMYGIVHLIPILIYKRKSVLTKPKETVLEYILKVLKSVGFFMSYCAGVRFSLCFLNWLRNGKYDMFNVLFMVTLANFSILFENSSRIMEYAIFTYPRSIEGLWDMLKKLNIVKSIKYGSQLIFAISVAISLVLNKNKKDILPPSYKRIIDVIFGNDIDKY